MPVTRTAPCLRVQIHAAAVPRRGLDRRRRARRAGRARPRRRATSHARRRQTRRSGARRTTRVRSRSASRVAVPDRPERLRRRADLHDARAQHQPLAERRRRSATACAAGRRGPAASVEVDGAVRAVAAVGQRRGHAADGIRLPAVRAAAVQLTSTATTSTATSRRRTGSTRAAARDGAELVVLPEKWPALGAADVMRGRRRAAPTDAARAGRAGIAARARASTSSPARSRSATARPAPQHRDPRRPGRRDRRRRYTKMHLFDVEVDGRAYRESDARGRRRRAGRHAAPPAASSVGLAICYDLRFPALFEALRRRGLRAARAPSRSRRRATTGTSSCARARSSSRRSSSPPTRSASTRGGMRSGGRSMIVDPWGVVLAQAPTRRPTSTADLDLDALHRIRAELPALQHRRTRGAA